MSMISYKKASQGGSIKIYWIVGLILVIGVAFAINFARERAEQARKEQAIAVSDDKANQTKDTPSAEEEDNQKPVVVQDSNDNQTAKPPTEQSSTLPRSGPSDTSGLLMIGLLVGLVTAWAKSHITLKRSL